MAEDREFYADGIEQIHFVGGMVRIDFMTLQPEENGGEENTPPKPQVSRRLIMPPQGFVNTFNSMQQLIDKLVDAGLVQKNGASRS